MALLRLNPRMSRSYKLVAFFAFLVVFIAGFLTHMIMPAQNTYYAGVALPCYQLHLGLFANKKDAESMCGALQSVIGCVSVMDVECTGKKYYVIISDSYTDKEYVNKLRQRLYNHGCVAIIVADGKPNDYA